MGLKRKMFDLVADSVVRGFGLSRANGLTCNILPKVVPTYRAENKGVSCIFHCPNSVALWRAKTLFTKEPETIDWIDTFQPGDVFFDIGANVGSYSVYAAKRGVDVVAFEPESQNYALLNRNIYLNALAERAMCLNIALSDRAGLDYLYLSDFSAGEALHNYGERLDWRHESFEPSYRQGVIAYSLDSFLSAFPERFPAHIKIDVDGAELKIVCGAEKTLRDKRLKSLLVEVNEGLPADLELVELVKAAGFRIERRAHAPMFDHGEYKGLYNYVFVRA